MCIRDRRIPIVHIGIRRVCRRMPHTVCPCSCTISWICQLFLLLTALSYFWGSRTLLLIHSLAELGLLKLGVFSHMPWKMVEAPSVSKCVQQLCHLHVVVRYALEPIVSCMVSAQRRYCLGSGWSAISTKHVVSEVVRYRCSGCGTLKTIILIDTISKEVHGLQC